MDAAGAVFDDDERVETTEQHCIHMDEVGRHDGAGLRGQELLPGRAGAAWCRVDPGIMQDLPHRGCCDRMAELDEFALHPPVPPARIVGRNAEYELADRGCRRRPPRTSAAAGVAPFASDEPPMPGEQRRRVTANTSPHRRRGTSRDSADSHSRSPGW